MKFRRILWMPLLIAMAACTARDPGSEIYDENDETPEMEQMEDYDPADVTENPNDSANNNSKGSDEDPIRDPDNLNQ